MDIRQVVRLPNGAHVARISVVMLLRSIWHILNGQRLRRHLEWRRAMKAAEAEHRRRSEYAKAGWVTRRRNAEIARALESFGTATENTPRCKDCTHPIGASEFIGKGLYAECGCTANHDNIEGAPV